MAEVNIRFDLTFSRRFLKFLGVAAILLCAVAELESETVTLSTYYPAPSGVYTDMITANRTWLGRNIGVAPGGGVMVGSALAPFEAALDIYGAAVPGGSVYGPAVVVHAQSNTDAVRVTPNANGQTTVAFGVTNAANSAYIAKIQKDGLAYFDRSVLIGSSLGGAGVTATMVPRVPLEVAGTIATHQVCVDVNWATGVQNLCTGLNKYITMNDGLMTGKVMLGVPPVKAMGRGASQTLTADFSGTGRCCTCTGACPVLP